jgi:homoserine dehydrogenase
MKKLNVAILGLGVVGGGTYDILRTNRDLITERTGCEIEVRKIFGRRHRDDVAEELFTLDYDEILNDPETDVVCETLGGVEPALSFMLEAMRRGKHVVTANKAAVAAGWDELNETAKLNGVQFLYEASVCGGMPVLSAIRGNLSANRFLEVRGIINSTTNYILSKMAREGKSYEEALKDAQAMGTVERDPSSDVSGMDSANKLCILMSLLFGKHIPPEEIPRTGITELTKEDMAEAGRNGQVIKLVARAWLEGDELKCYVRPERIAKDDPLAMANNEKNALIVTSDMSGINMFYGNGAGPLVTGSAVAGDILSIALMGGK